MFNIQFGILPSRLKMSGASTTDEKKKSAKYTKIIRFFECWYVTLHYYLYHHAVITWILTFNSHFCCWCWYSTVSLSCGRNWVFLTLKAILYFKFISSEEASVHWVFGDDWEYICVLHEFYWYLRYRLPFKREAEIYYISPKCLLLLSMVQIWTYLMHSCFYVLMFHFKHFHRFFHMMVVHGISFTHLK